MYSFKMQNVETLASAVEHFGSSDDAVYLAGGHTLIPAMKQRLRAPEDVIDLSNIPGLGDIVGESREKQTQFVYAQKVVHE